MGTFKFIERTEHVELHRGIKPDDGLIRIEYAFENSKPFSPVHVNDPWDEPWIWKGNRRRGDRHPEIFYTDTIGAHMSSINCSTQCSVPLNEEGITVEGSDSHQQFVSSHIGDVGTSEVIVFKLKGSTTGNVKVNRPISTTTKIKCKTCGRSHRSGKQYCDRCGARLVVK